jgi:hypothetical protein
VVIAALQIGRTGGGEAIVPVEHHSSTHFRGLEAKERELADHASSPDVREIYLSLAKQYRYLAENAEAAERVEHSRTSVEPSLSN